mmetsp:Transcript_31653/g.70387  ORF Transcript_31653/g.70387 Transcript_31653/m.70387 type:complete len:241 (-) Transcript_31653:2-724(-)
MYSQSFQVPLPACLRIHSISALSHTYSCHAGCHTLRLQCYSKPARGNKVSTVRCDGAAQSLPLPGPGVAVEHHSSMWGAAGPPADRVIGCSLVGGPPASVDDLKAGAGVAPHLLGLVPHAGVCGGIIGAVAALEGPIPPAVQRLAVTGLHPVGRLVQHVLRVGLGHGGHGAGQGDGGQAAGGAEPVDSVVEEHLDAVWANRANRGDGDGGNGDGWRWGRSVWRWWRKGRAWWWRGGWADS